MEFEHARKYIIKHVYRERKKMRLSTGVAEKASSYLMPRTVVRPIKVTPIGSSARVRH
jgi:hypothetical protein